MKYLILIFAAFLFCVPPTPQPIIYYTITMENQFGIKREQTVTKKYFDYNDFYVPFGFRVVEWKVVER